ncbi:aspartyl protease family protein [Sunxiuqinia sp. A32]|uniref:aspartyl protease family protein n=1 Tax=Sunxiuqinia sp. A32 TaxID=3461496 RepID=UPI004045EAE1
MRNTLPLKLVELENSNFHILLDCKFANGELGSWIIDTGASKSVFDISLKDYYQLVERNDYEEYHSAGINEGTVATEVGEIDELKFGKLKIEKFQVALINLDHVNDIYRRYHDLKIVGLIGGDVLYRYGCVIDYQYKSISFSKRHRKKHALK